MLLTSAQNFRTVALSPWLLMPVLFVVVTVMTFMFLGDGLRDAATTPPTPTSNVRQTWAMLAALQPFSPSSALQPHLVLKVSRVIRSGSWRV